jgi:hypothetical protein
VVEKNLWIIVTLLETITPFIFLNSDLLKNNNKKAMNISTKLKKIAIKLILSLNITFTKEPKISI